MANINKIRLSGTTYNLQDSNATKTVELTQAQYDALSTKDPNTFYIITDAQGADLSQYYTSAQTESAITQAVSGKQDTLVSGTNIKTINNESILGSGNITIQGGGKAVSGGTNISITTGETADTINCTLPYYRDSGNCWTIYGYNSSYYANSSTKAEYSAYIGLRNVINNTSYLRYTQNNIIIGFDNKLESNYTEYYMGGNIIIGENNTLSGANNIRESYVIGKNNKGYGIQEFICGWANEARNTYETSFGYRNISTSGVSTFGYSGNTLFSIGNGYYFGSDRHNAFEIRQNGDIYIADTNDTSTTNYYQKPMIKLQDALGGGSSYTAGDGIDITNDVISVTGKVDTSAITTSISSSSTDAQVPSAKAVYDQLGGMKIVKLTESEYTALVTKDNNTLYVVVPDPSN